MLLLISFCALYRRRAQNTLGLSVVLFLLANAAPYGLLIALIFSALLVFDWARNEESPSLRAAPHLRVSALIVLAGVACATLQLVLMKASPGTVWKHPFTVSGISDTVINIWRAYVPIPIGFPSLSRWAWGTDFIDAIPARQFVKVGLALMLAVISAGVLLKKPPARFLYVVGVAALLSIQFIVNSGAMRHKAFLFLLFLAPLWVAGVSVERESSRIPLRRLGTFFDRIRTPFVVGLLAIQTVAGAYT